MNKKLTIIGKGSVGSLAVMQFLNLTDWDIEWVFDENIPVASVGEASNLVLTQVLARNEFFQDDLLKINGSPKTGILKENWSDNKNYFHPFSIKDVAMHFTAKELHNLIYEKVKNNQRLSIVNKNIDDPEKLDSDYVLVCSGSPKDIDKNEYNILQEVPVNSVYVVQCPWDHLRFNYSLTNAMQYGWVFGIPLQNRISIGYLYNDKINTLEEIKEDIKKVFEQYNLIPSESTNHLSFKSYFRKKNFGSKVCYNGNASFFVEPLEATSIGHALTMNLQALLVWTNQTEIQEADLWSQTNIRDISSMIALHYLAGSKYKTDFWKEALLKSENKIKNEFLDKTEWSQYLYSILVGNLTEKEDKDIGTWRLFNYKLNIEGLDIKNKLFQIINSTKSISFNKEEK